MKHIAKTTTGLWMAVAVTSIGIFTACNKSKQATVPIQTEAAERRDIVVTTEGTGTVEPIDTVAVR